MVCLQPKNYRLNHSSCQFLCPLTESSVLERGSEALSPHYVESQLMKLSAECLLSVDSTLNIRTLVL